VVAGGFSPPVVGAGRLMAADRAIRNLDPSRIKPGRWQSRKHFDHDALEELAASIREHGLLQPVIVRHDPSDGMYELIAGERRWRAALLAQEPTIPAVVRNDLDDRQAHVACLVENLQREDLNPIEEAEGYRELLDAGMTQMEAAKRLGISRSHLANLVRLLELAPRVQRLLMEEALEVGHVKPLRTLPPKWQVRIAEQAVRMRWSVRRVEQQAIDAKRIVSGERTNTKAEEAREDPDLSRLQRDLSDASGLPATLTLDKQGKGGRIRFRFHSNEELEGFLELLLRNTALQDRLR